MKKKIKDLTLEEVKTMCEYRGVETMSIEVKIYFTLLVICAILMSIGFGISFINERIGTILILLSFTIFFIEIVSGILILIWRY